MHSANRLCTNAPLYVTILTVVDNVLSSDGDRLYQRQLVTVVVVAETTVRLCMPYSAGTTTMTYLFAVPVSQCLEASQ